VLLPGAVLHRRRRWRRRSAAAGALVLVLAAAAGCGGRGKASPPAVAPAAEEACPGPAGSWTDIAGEPVGWRAASSGRTWTDASGCTVRIDVVADYDGAAHCGFRGARYLALGAPVGARDTRPRVEPRYLVEIRDTR
jgi:hypothetical protein